MTPAELLRSEAAKRLVQAAKDRKSAKALVNVEASRSVFHSQQAAEKAIKGFLTLRQIAFRKTHSLTELGAQCASADPTLEPILRGIEELTDYASAFRYPDATYEPDAAEANGSVDLSRPGCTTTGMT
jgi:HEPN domain-containing protein